jgi:hypothetical protein
VGVIVPDWEAVGVGVVCDEVSVSPELFLLFVASTIAPAPAPIMATAVNPIKNLFDVMVYLRIGITMLTDIKKYLKLKNITFQFTILLTISFLIHFLALIGLNIFNFQQYWEAEAFTSNLIKFLALIAVIDLFYVANYYFFKLKNVNYLHLVITGFILYLLLNPTNPLWVFFLAPAVTMATKWLLRYKGMPIFNPAALGLFITYFIGVLLKNSGVIDSNIFVSWWGASVHDTLISKDIYATLITVIICLGFVYYAYKFRRHVLALTFLGVYLLFVAAQMWGDSHSLDLTVSFLNFLVPSSLIFMACVMMIEPKTSPAYRNHQIFLGIVGALLLFFLRGTDRIATIPLPEISIILILNLLNFYLFRVNRTFLMKKTVVKTTVTTTQL